MRELSNRKGTFVNRLRIVGSRVERVSAMRAIESLIDLARVDSRLPPSAILFIRTLRDPRPGLARLDGGRRGSQVEWVQSLQREVDRIAREAARPALEHVGAGAEAVWFADRAELLCTLASDWCSGNAITRWWWQSLFRASDVSSAVIAEWLASVEHVPSAFAKLAQRSEAVKFAGSLPATAVSRLLDGLTWSFGLTELRDSLSQRKNEDQPRRPVRSARMTDSPRKRRDLPASSEMSERLARWAPEAYSPSLTQNARVLVAAALMLERAPALLRERRFASQLPEILIAAQPGEAAGQAILVETEEFQIAQTTDAVAGDASKSHRLISSSNASRNLQSPNSQTTSGQELPSDDRMQQGVHSLSVEEQRRANLVSNLTSQSPAQPAETLVVTAERRAAHWLSETAVSETEVSAAAIVDRIETKLGGVFYLINAALALNLYGDFTTPLEPGIELPVWDFLALMGRELGGREIEADPIFELLRRLAGRKEGEEPGSTFEPPDDWRIPPSWLSAFPERVEWSYQTSRGRLVVRHPAGFTAVDIKLSSKSWRKDIHARLASETSCYSNISRFRRRRSIGVKLDRREQGLERWKKWLADYLRVRLARAIGIEPKTDSPGISNRQLKKLFKKTARVEVTPARLDVFFSLDELPVEIRLSGLDRDPGWLPGAGRAIAFHYD